jgi:hypothetical protein
VSGETRRLADFRALTQDEVPNKQKTKAFDRLMKCGFLQTGEHSEDLKSILLGRSFREFIEELTLFVLKTGTKGPIAAFLQNYEIKPLVVNFLLSKFRDGTIFSEAMAYTSEQMAASTSEDEIKEYQSKYNSAFDYLSFFFLFKELTSNDKVPEELLPFVTEKIQSMTQQIDPKNNQIVKFWTKFSLIISREYPTILDIIFESFNSNLNEISEKEFFDIIQEVKGQNSEVVNEFANKFMKINLSSKKVASYFLENCVAEEEVLLALSDPARGRRIRGLAIRKLGSDFLDTSADSLVHIISDNNVSEDTRRVAFNAIVHLKRIPNFVKDILLYSFNESDRQFDIIINALANEELSIRQSEVLEILEYVSKKLEATSSKKYNMNNRNHKQRYCHDFEKLIKRVTAVKQFLYTADSIDGEELKNRVEGLFAEEVERWFDILVEMMDWDLLEIYLKTFDFEHLKKLIESQSYNTTFENRHYHNYHAPKLFELLSNLTLEVRVRLFETYARFDSSATKGEIRKIILHMCYFEGFIPKQVAYEFLIKWRNNRLSSVGLKTETFGMVLKCFINQKFSPGQYNDLLEVYSSSSGIIKYELMILYLTEFIVDKREDREVRVDQPMIRKLFIDERRDSPEALLQILIGSVGRNQELLDKYRSLTSEDERQDFEEIELSEFPFADDKFMRLARDFLSNGLAKQEGEFNLHLIELLSEFPYLHQIKDSIEQSGQKLRLRFRRIFQWLIDYIFVKYDVSIKDARKAIYTFLENSEFEKKEMSEKERRTIDRLENYIQLNWKYTEESMRGISKINLFDFMLTGLNSVPENVVIVEKSNKTVLEYEWIEEFTKYRELLNELFSRYFTELDTHYKLTTNLLTAVLNSSQDFLSVQMWSREDIEALQSTLVKPYELNNKIQEAAYVVMARNKFGFEWLLNESSYSIGMDRLLSIVHRYKNWNLYEYVSSDDLVVDVNELNLSLIFLYRQNKCTPFASGGYCFPVIRLMILFPHPDCFHIIRSWWQSEDYDSWGVRNLIKKVISTKRKDNKYGDVDGLREYLEIKGDGE